MIHQTVLVLPKGQIRFKVIFDQSSLMLSSSHLLNFWHVRVGESQAY